MQYYILIVAWFILLAAIAWIVYMNCSFQIFDSIQQIFFQDEELEQEASDTRVQAVKTWLKRALGTLTGASVTDEKSAGGNTSA